MKDSQLNYQLPLMATKYIKANNERFSTWLPILGRLVLSISRRIMKDSQQSRKTSVLFIKYIKANNERFSTANRWDILVP